jgi:hypothetical protein
LSAVAPRGSGCFFATERFLYDINPVQLLDNSWRETYPETIGKPARHRMTSFGGLRSMDIAHTVLAAKLAELR